MSDNPLAALAMRERAAKACDGFCNECARAIRALPTTFTDAEMTAAAVQLPEVRALEAFAHYLAGTNKDKVTVILAGNPNVCDGVINAARYALAAIPKETPHE